MKGLSVLCLEAGRTVDPAKDFYTHKFPYEWLYRGRGKPGQYGKLPLGMEWKIEEWTDHLYTIPAEDPYALASGAKFTWTRLRAVGGRTLLWGRGCDRFGPLDFRAKSLQDGWGEDWPVTYEEVAPYYDKVEALIGVSGSAEDVFNTPSGKGCQNEANCARPIHSSGETPASRARVNQCLECGRRRPARTSIA
jgi:choline dehydrogenase-like flavoprotein